MENKYKPLVAPKDSSWDRKTYNPIKLLNWYLYENHRYTTIGEFLIKILDFLNDVESGIKNLYFWIPTIWKDRNWDHSYIYTTLERKIYLQREYLVSNNRHERVDIDNRDMTIVLNLIDKVKNESYLTEYFDYNESTFDFVEIDMKDEKGCKLYELKSEIISENFEDYLNIYKNSTRIVKNKFKDKESDKYIIPHRVGLHNHLKAKKLLFKILEQRMDYWWD
jgi:hypothetical protein